MSPKNSTIPVIYGYERLNWNEDEGGGVQVAPSGKAHVPCETHGWVEMVMVKKPGGNEFPACPKCIRQHCKITTAMYVGTPEEQAQRAATNSKDSDDGHHDEIYTDFGGEGD